MGVILGTATAGSSSSGTSHTLATVTNGDSPYTPPASERTYICDTSGGAISIDLSSVSSAGWIATFKRDGASAVTFTENIDGVSKTLAFDKAMLTIVYDGTSFFSI